MQPVVGSAGNDRDHRFLRFVLDRDVAVGKRPRDVEKEPAGNDDNAFARNLRVQRRAQRDLHVGRREMELTRLRAQLNPAEYEDGRAGRHTACDGCELGRQLVSRDGNPQTGAHYDF